METQNLVMTDIPEFKLAKVGKGKKERKRAGAGWFGSRGAGSGLRGLLGGAEGGAGGALGAGVGAGAAAEGAAFAGLSMGKVLLALALAVGASAGAWQIGKSMSAGDSGAAAGGKKLFSDKGGQYADTSNVIKPENGIPNSLGYVAGSLDGLTPEERAKKQAAEAEAARKAAEDAEAARKAAEAADAARSAAPTGKAPVDAGSMAGLTGGMGGLGSGGGRMSKLNGSLSGLGGVGGSRGLSGGAGLSGGINQNFGANGGLKKGDSGSLSAFRSGSKPKATSAPRTLTGASKSKGFAKRQLDNAFTQSKQASTAGKTEAASSGAAVPFDGANSGGGTTIGGGPGVTTGGTSRGTPDGGIMPNNPTDGTPVNTNTDNGNTNAPACDPGYFVNTSGLCQKVGDTHSGGSTQYQWMLDLAKKLMMAVTVLAALALIYFATGLGWGIATIIKGIILTLGGIITLLGIGYGAASGDMMTGGIVAAVGAFTVASAMIPANIASLSTNGLAQLAAGALISNAVGMMATSANQAHKATAAMQ